MSRLFGEPPRDPELGDALRQMEAMSPPGSDEALRIRIVAASRPRLAELRAPAREWWEWISGWGRVAVPVGVAAGLAALLLVPGRGDLIGVGTTGVVTGADSTLVIAAFSEPGAGNLSHLIAPASDDSLLAQVLDQ